MHSASNLKLTVALGLALVLPCHGLTYWLDGSCAGTMRDSIAEGLSMATRSNARIADGADTDMESVFKRIFKVDKSDVGSYGTVTNIVSGISVFTETNDRPGSDIRVYCDDDDSGGTNRWQLVPDIPGDPFPNSGRAPNDQEWVDTVNHVRRSTATMGCKDGGTQGETFSLLPSTPVPGENNSRATITICRMQTTAAMQTLPAKQKDLTTLKTLDPFDAITSLVVLHEFTHLPAYGTVDHAYMWGGLIALSNTQALANADSYAYFGLLGLLGDRRYRLGKREADANAGKLVYTPTTTTTPKRGVARLRKDRRMRLRWINDLGFFGSGGKISI